MGSGQMNDNKEKIISLIMENQDILKCIKYKENDCNILNKPDLTVKEKIAMRQSNIFKYRKIPIDTVIEQEIYLSMEYGEIYYMGGSGGYYSSSNPYFKIPDFIFYVITHNSLDENKIIGSRVDRIEEEIYNIFHNKLTLEDFGKSYILNSKPLYLPKDYIGRQITLRFVGRNN